MEGWRARLFKTQHYFILFFFNHHVWLSSFLFIIIIIIPFCHHFSLLWFSIVSRPGHASSSATCEGSPSTGWLIFAGRKAWRWWEFVQPKYQHMGVSKNRGTPKSSILIRCSIINHPFWGTPIFGHIHTHGTPRFERTVLSSLLELGQTAG